MFKKLNEKKNLLVKSRGNGTGYDTLVNTPPATLSIPAPLNEPVASSSGTTGGVHLVDTRVADNDDEGKTCF